jgi:hypothetical protein
MDSEVDLSLLALSTTQDSIEIRLKKLKRGKSTHIIWVHTYNTRDREDS